MAQQWDAEQIIEPQTALELVQQQFPELNAKNIRLLGAGWDNSAFIIDEGLIFRFPRREIALALLEAEWQALPKLATRLPVPIPIPEWKGEPSDKFPWPFIGYKMLAGFTACYANLSEGDREALAEPIALFLKRLHSTPPALLEGCKFEGDYMCRIEGSWITKKLVKNLKELSLLNILENIKQIETVIQDLQDYEEPKLNTVVHGDFYVRHLLLNDKHQLAGVIDWGDVHIGDPAIDLAIAHSFLPPGAHSKFRNTYGEISEKTWSLAKLRSIHSSVLIVLFGYHSGQPDLVREGLRSLKIIAG